MLTIGIDRTLFLRLVDRWYKVEIEHRAFRSMLEEAKRRNPDNAKNLEALYQLTADSLRHDPTWIDSESQLSDALATEDDDAFLDVLNQFLSHRESGQ